MSQLPMIMLPDGLNYHGRRIFIEVFPTDNPNLLSKQAGDDFKHVILKMRTPAAFQADLRGAKIIPPN